MDNLIYDLLCRQADNIGMIVCKDLGIEFSGTSVLSYEFRGEFVIEVEAIKEGNEIEFEVTEKKYGELIY